MVVENLPEIWRGDRDNRDSGEARREEVARLKLHGYTQAQISRKLGVSQQTISIDMRKIREEWKRNMTLSYEQHVAQELAHLDEIEQELSKAIEDGKTEFIRDRIKINAEKRRLLGLDSPVKHEIQVVSIDALDAEIARLEGLIGEVVEVAEPEIVEAEIVE